MAHEAHHDSHHAQADTRPTTSSSASFWFVIILVGLFIASVNFVSVMSHDTGGHSTEHAAPAGHENSHESGQHAEEAHNNTNSEAH